jgi:hypothetical protein
MPLAAESRQRASRLADGPFHRMQAESPIGNVGGANVLTACQQVTTRLRDEGA